MKSDGVSFQVHHIYGTYAAGFPGAKIQQQHHAPKPHIDGMVLIMCQNKPLEQLLALFTLKLWLQTWECSYRVLVRRRR